MRNTVKIARLLLVVNCVVLVLNSCGIKNCYYSKFSGERGDSISYKLSIKRKRYTFEKREYPNFYTNFSGVLLKKGLREFEFIDEVDDDSIVYPFKFVNDKKNTNRFVLKIPISIILGGQIFLNDSLFINIKFDKWAKLLDTTIVFEQRPKKVQIFSMPYKDVLFNWYDIKPKSIVYVIPDTCNTLIMENIPFNSRSIGINHLVFNKRRGTLCVNTNCIKFKKCR